MASQVLAEPFPDLDDEVMYPRLTDAKLERLAERSERRRYAPCDVLYEQGVRDAPFFVIERGLVRFIDHRPGRDVLIAKADARTFLGDIAVFTGEPSIAACVAVESTDVIAFERGELREMLAGWPEFAELVLRTLAARRAWHERTGHGVLRLIASRGRQRAFQVRDLLERNLLPVRSYDLDTEPEAGDMLDELGIPHEETPVLIRNAGVLRNPSAAQVAPNCASVISDQTVERYFGVYPGPGVAQYPAGSMWAKIVAIGPFACAACAAVGSSGSSPGRSSKSRKAR